MMKYTNLSIHKPNLRWEVLLLAWSIILPLNCRRGDYWSEDYDKGIPLSRLYNIRLVTLDALQSTENVDS